MICHYRMHPGTKSNLKFYFSFILKELNKQNFFYDLLLMTCSEYDLFLNINSGHPEIDGP